MKQTVIRVRDLMTLLTTYANSSLELRMMTPQDIVNHRNAVTCAQELSALIVANPDCENLVVIVP